MMISIAARSARVAAVALLCAAAWAPRVRAFVPADSGVPELRAITTNLDGSGIAVAQPEASLTDDDLTWEVNPAGAPQPNALFTYTTLAGTTNGFPNTRGCESGHADTVGGIFYGTANGVAPGVVRVDGFEADFFFYHCVCTTNPPTFHDAVVNQSFTFGPLAAADQEAVDLAFDTYAELNQTLFVSAADNYGNSPVVCAPGTAYNGISVGAYANGTYANSLGPTLDNGRCKPDLTAIGEETSFSTPLVAGAAAVLMQAALRGDGGANTNAAADRRSIKALLLNGAVKPPDWTNSATSPLDARYGAGVMNLLNAYENLAGGQSSFASTGQVPLGAPHSPEGHAACIPAAAGWDFNTLTSGVDADAVNHYRFRPAAGAGGAALTLTATLVWNRQLNQTNLNHLSLLLYDCATGNQVAASTSLVDNVQHIYAPGLPPGGYDLQVWKAGGPAGPGEVSDAETYALAWAWVSPALTITSCGGNPALVWPLYPAGFAVESTTNWLCPAWSTNSLAAPIITNGQNQLLIYPSNPTRLFRLNSH